MKTTLPFSMPMKAKNKYHSQFLCPVSKELLASKEGTVLFKCGHVISETAYNKILENRGIRRKLKCPICQEEQKAEDIMQVEF